MLIYISCIHMCMWTSAGPAVPPDRGAPRQYRDPRPNVLLLHDAQVRIQSDLWKMIIPSLSCSLPGLSLAFSEANSDVLGSGLSWHVRGEAEEAVHWFKEPRMQSKMWTELCVDDMNLRISPLTALS